MEPKAFLEQAESDYRAGKLGRQGMWYAIVGYRQWRQKGGSNPTMSDGTSGDKFVTTLGAELSQFEPGTRV